ncbi:uncharacterized protein WM294_001654 isoform 1-T2 [Sarcoramphus papa]
MSLEDAAGQDALRRGSPRRAAHGPQQRAPHDQAPSRRNLAVSDFSRSCFAAVKQEEQDNLNNFITWVLVPTSPLLLAMYQLLINRQMLEKRPMYIAHFHSCKCGSPPVSFYSGEPNCYDSNE